MNVLFVAQCTKRALTETRRILDQFAERRGERTWQTPITQAGLDTVRKLLRQTARKNTAVACHWIHGRDHSELLWVVGDASQFNDQGAVPTNTTASNVLRAGDENAWHHLHQMAALAALAALLHDLGKATQAFQDKLKNPGLRERNHYRHEWVSVRLFQAFVGQDDDSGWLQRLAACADADTDAQALEATWLDHAGGRLLRDGLDEPQAKQHLPFAHLPPLAQAVAWLVFTHHRLPCMPVEKAQDVDAQDMEDGRRIHHRFGARLRFLNPNVLDDILLRISADWNEPRERAEPSTVRAHWHFPHGLPVTMPAWRKQAARYARKLLELSQAPDQGQVLHDPFAMHVARLCLMLADHHYSSLTDTTARAPYLSQGYPLYANTRSNHYQNNSFPRFTDKRQSPLFNQTLDEHLLGVQAHATLVARSLPSLTHSLPALKNHKPLKKRSADPRFAWQDKAADLAASVRHRAAAQGAFIVNMASTGCGKTLGNARVMNALADPATGMRCAFAMGLRTLTLQTGRVFQNDLQLSDEQLALQVGGAASRALFEYWEQQAEATGSASSQALLDEAGTVLYEGNDQHPLLQRLTDDAKARALIAAPLLVCTVDHLTPATESLRGSRQIAPMLRLLTSDLVLDEPDDFDMADLPALTRLVHWAGLLGSRVLLSSATLSPALVEGLFLAYRAGRAVYQRHRSERPSEGVNVCCLWIDEFHKNLTVQDCADGAAFRTAHTQYAHKRVAKLQQAEVRRLTQIAALPDTWHGMQEAERRKDFARLVLAQAWQLHQQPHNHSTDTTSGKCVSLGLIRMANIAPLYDVALAMYAPDALPPELQGTVRIHLCVYHSQFPLLLRSAIEQQLDTLLNRRGAKDGHDPALHRPALCALIDAHSEPHHLFIVLGSPVTEVGRDHDYDWAVVEPSSMRSLIQLAGRVRRHRPGAVGGVNMVVLDSNLRHYEKPQKPAYEKPGFETAHAPFQLKSPHLHDLLAREVGEAAAWAVDAQPRIALPADKLLPTLLAPLYATSLAHAVHAQVQEDRFGEANKAARQARRERKMHDGVFHDYPGLAVQNMGGSNKQNLGLLNVARGGKNYLLSSLPPQWKVNEQRFPTHTDSVFTRYFDARPLVRQTVKMLRRYLESNPNPVKDTRDHRKELVDVLVDEMVAMAAELQHALPPGWTLNDPRFSKLNKDEQTWLDALRAEQPEEEDFANRWLAMEWPDAIGTNFGNWLNARLEGKLSFSDIEFREWKKELLTDEDGFSQQLRERRKRIRAARKGGQP